MDYSDIYTMFKQLLKAQGINISCVEKHETLYYDESGNSKHLLIKDSGELNSDEDSMFVLGGVQAENPISMDDLKSFMKKDINAELKASKDLTCIIHSRPDLTSLSPSDWPGFLQSHTDFPSKAA